jgi:hypothetical protein
MAFIFEVCGEGPDFVFISSQLVPFLADDGGGSSTSTAEFPRKMVDLNQKCWA